MNGGFGGDGAQANAAADLECIETEQVGFQELASGHSIRLFPAPWPNEQYPPTTASLLTIASERGLLAAAGPDVLILGTTKSVRESYKAADKDTVYSPQASIPIPRVSQVTFSSDEKCLVITAESGGGLAVYEVDALLSGNKDPAFQMPTEGVAVRHILPNPNKDNSHLFVVVLDDGKLLLANLNTREFVSGANGTPIFRNTVSSACWSRLGKQIVAGLSDGTAAQIDLQGNVKAEIPQPPNLYDDRDRNVPLPVTGIYWLETLDFLMIHAPVNPPDDSMAINDAIYHLVHRDKQSGRCSFHRFKDDPCPGWLSGRLPAHHFIQRVREWPPDLDDTILLGSTLSEGVGLITRSKVPLAQDAPTHLYTTTTPEQDIRRANMPVSYTGDMNDIYMIGMALDLSTEERVWRPVAGEEDEIEWSSIPLPAVCVLNHEGVLSMWYLIYNESIRKGVRAPGVTRNLITAQGQPAQGKLERQPQASAPAGSASLTPFGAPPTAPAPAQPSQQPTFGQSSTPSLGGFSAFGKQPPAFGQPASPSPSTPAFGKPSAPGGVAFGAPSGFGQAAGMGASKPSPWGTPAQGQASSGSTFGQPSGAFGGNASAQSPFASFAKPGGNNAAASPFSSFAKPSGGDGNKLASPFASFSKDEKPAASPFSSFASAGGSFGNDNKAASPFAAAGQQKPGMPGDPSFGSTVTLNSTTGGSFGSAGAFGQGSGFASSSFGKASEPREEKMGGGESSAKPADQSSSLGGLGSGGFKIGSTFKGDGTAKDDGPKPKNPGAGLFGSNFGSSLDIADKKEEPSTPVKEEPDTAQEPKLGDIPEASTTPASPPKQEKSSQPEAAPLPPDFTKAAPNKEESPLPVPDDAPLPPDFGPSKSGKAEDVPIAGSPPLDVGNEKFSASASSAGEETGPPEDDDEADWSEEDGEDNAEDGESGEGDEDDGDDDSEQSEDEDDHTVEDPAGLSAFESRVQPASPQRNQPQDETNTPPTDKKTTYTPAGFPKPNINFAPPSRPLQESPRSPSPVRSVTGPAQLRQSQQAPGFGRISVPPAQPVERPASRPKSATPQPPPAPVDLEDEEDARIKAILEAPIEPTKELPEFLAHHDYDGGSDKPGIAGQMERIYRDINSMVDTLGLNARSLEAFVQGHSQARDPNGPLSRADLDNEESWVFAESNELQGLIEGIYNGLEQGKLDDPQGKLEDLQEEDQELMRLRTKAAEVRRQMASRVDPEQRAAQLNAPLPAETANQQKELRQGVQKLQKLLAEAEEAMSLLRADMASLPSAGRASNAPTVEAVTNTILKMTAIIEKKSGDVDVLESQIRCLPRGIASLRLDDDYEDDLVNTMRGSKLLAASTGSPRATPPQPRITARGDPLGMTGMFGARSTPTPPTVGRRALPDLGANGLGRSMGSVGGSARKKMQDVTPEEAQGYVAKRERRSRLLGALQEGVERRGTRIVRVER